jgi:hypothetical protein
MSYTGTHRLMYQDCKTKEVFFKCSRCGCWVLRKDMAKRKTSSFGVASDCKSCKNESEKRRHALKRRKSW